MSTPLPKTEEAPSTERSDSNDKADTAKATGEQADGRKGYDNDECDTDHDTSNISVKTDGTYFTVCGHGEPCFSVLRLFSLSHFKL